MSQKATCCTAAPKLFFACSGAADVGEISDRAARQLTAEGAGKMFCTPGIGGRVEPIMETTRKAAAILALDGCGQDCVRKSLELAGFGGFRHLRVTDLGMEKGKSPASPERIDQVVQAGRAQLSA